VSGLHSLLVSVVLPIVESSIAHCHNSSYCPTQISIIFITRQFFVESRQCCIFMRKFDSPLAPRVLKPFLPQRTNLPYKQERTGQTYDLTIPHLLTQHFQQTTKHRLYLKAEETFSRTKRRQANQHRTSPACPLEYPWPQSQTRKTFPHQGPRTIPLTLSLMATIQRMNGGTRRLSKQPQPKRLLRFGYLNGQSHQGAVASTSKQEIGKVFEESRSDIRYRNQYGRNRKGGRGNRMQRQA